MRDRAGAGLVLQGTVWLLTRQCAEREGRRVMTAELDKLGQDYARGGRRLCSRALACGRWAHWRDIYADTPGMRAWKATVHGAVTWCPGTMTRFASHGVRASGPSSRARAHSHGGGGLMVVVGTETARWSARCAVSLGDHLGSSPARC